MLTINNLMDTYDGEEVGSRTRRYRGRDVMGVNKPSTPIVYRETLWLYKFVMQAKLISIGRTA